MSLVILSLSVNGTAPPSFLDSSKNFLFLGKGKNISTQMLVAHACNPSYSGSRDQEDHGLKPARADSSRDPISKKSNTHKKTKASEVA
jgi:hypothetical protein